MLSSINSLPSKLHFYFVMTNNFTLIYNRDQVLFKFSLVCLKTNSTAYCHCLCTWILDNTLISQLQKFLMASVQKAAGTRLAVWSKPTSRMDVLVILRERSEALSSCLVALREVLKDHTHILVSNTHFSGLTHDFCLVIGYRKC